MVDVFTLSFDFVNVILACLILVYKKWCLSRPLFIVKLCLATDLHQHVIITSRLLRAPSFLRPPKMRLTFVLFATVGVILIGKSELNPAPLSSKKCYKELVKHDVIKDCKKENLEKHPFTLPPIDKLTEKPLADHHITGNCDSDIHMMECINEKACKVCSVKDASAFGIYWYDTQVETIKGYGCKKAPKTKCQPPLTTLNPKGHTSHTTTDKSKNTLVTIIVVTIILLIIGAIAVYCLCFSSSGEEKKVGGEPKGVPKASQAAEGSISGAIKSTVKSGISGAINSGISAGGKSKVKSSLAEFNTSSKIGGKTLSQAKSKA